MAMSICIKIDLDESGTYTPAEAAVIAALANDVAANPAPAAAAPAEPAAAPAASKPAARRKPDPDAGDVILAKAKADLEAKQAAANLQEAVAKTPALDEVDNDAEALAAMEADLVSDAPTLQDAVTLATNMVGEGKAAQVKAALAAAGGAKRVSELKGDAIAAFMTAAQG